MRFHAIGLVLFTGLASALNLNCRIALNDTSSLGRTAYAELSGVSSSKTTLIGQSTGEIYFPSVEDGDYVLSFHSQFYIFPTYHVRVSNGGSSLSSRVIPAGEEARFDVPSGAFGPFQSTITPEKEINYYATAKPFDLVAFLNANKMMIFMGTGMLLSLALPKLLTMMDPEIMAEVQKNQNNLHSKVSAITSKIAPDAA